MFQFSRSFAIFINFSSFKPDTENNANFEWPRQVHITAPLYDVVQITDASSYGMDQSLSHWSWPTN